VTSQLRANCAGDDIAALDSVQANNICLPENFARTGLFTGFWNKSNNLHRGVVPTAVAICESLRRGF